MAKRKKKKIVFLILFFLSFTLLYSSFKLYSDQFYTNAHGVTLSKRTNNNMLRTLQSIGYNVSTKEIEGAEKKAKLKEFIVDISIVITSISFAITALYITKLIRFTKKKKIIITILLLSISIISTIIPINDLFIENRSGSSKVYSLDDLRGEGNNNIIDMDIKYYRNRAIFIIGITISILFGGYLINTLNLQLC